MILEKVIYLECWKHFEFLVSALVLLWKCISHYFGYKCAIYKRLTPNSFSSLNFVEKWFVFTLNSFKGFELKTKKIVCANKFGSKYYNI
jgi:hypothetical protein